MAAINRNNKRHTMTKFAVLLSTIVMISLGCDHKSSTSKTLSGDDTVSLGEPMVADSVQSISADCQAFSLSGPTCSGMQQATTIFDNISQVSGAASMVCTYLPDGTVTKAAAVGFFATSVISKVVVFTLKNIPCEETLSAAQQDEVARQVEAALAARGIDIKGPLVIPSHP